MSQEDTKTIHSDALELADLFRQGWPLIDARLRASGVPLCEGDDGAADEADEGDGDGDDDAAANGDGEGKTFDAEYVSKLRRENAAARKARQDAEAKVKEYEDRDKSESQRQKEATDAAERRAQKAEIAVLRLKVGQKKGLPVEIAELLHGDDEKAMAAHADQLIKAGVKAGGNGTTSLDGGAREGQAPAPGDMDAAIRRAAGHT